MLPTSCLSCPYRFYFGGLKIARLLFQDPVERDKEGILEQIESLDYPELLKRVGEVLIWTFESELDQLAKDPNQSLLVDPEAYSEMFLDENGEANDECLQAVRKASEDVTIFLRKKYPDQESLADLLTRDRRLLQQLAITTMNLQMSRMETRKVLERGGLDSKMKDFVNCNTDIGQARYDYIILKLLKEMKETGKPVSLLYIDLDHFGGVNEQFGHKIGDIVLTHAAKMIQETLRQHNGDGDICVRFGGEEMGAILVNTQDFQAVIAAERVRENLAKNPLYLVRKGRMEGGQLIESPTIYEIDEVRYKELRQRNHAEGDPEVARGTKIILIDQRDTNNRIILHKIPVTASIGIGACKDTEDDVFERAKQEANKNEGIAKGQRNAIAVDRKIIDTTDLERYRHLCQIATEARSTPGESIPDPEKKD